MLYCLTGEVIEVGQNSVILDVNGIGFLVNASLQTLSDVKAGTSAKLFISESIGENNYDLFGFSGLREKQFFELLISISGVGPKAALSLLSSLNTDALILAVANDDVKALMAAPGIGKKIAQRILLELKDKLGAELPSLMSSASSIQISPSQSIEGKEISDAVAGLSVLGYSTAEISAVIKKSDWTVMSADQIIREVLKKMI